MVVALPDGSTARLNRGASISVQWRNNERRVVLDSGETAFSVLHDGAHPFVVAVGDTTIRDVGTEFNVLRRPNGLTVTVREGAVEIKPASASPITVSAGEEFRTDTATHQAVLSRSNADDAFAWQDGRLVYHNATLAMIVDDLNRYAETPIRIADPAVGSLHFSGALVIQPSAGLVSQLQSFLPVRSELNKGEILLRNR
jgi:transmembrane sensor